jgi:uncharacterized protein (TIGR00369 family)
VTERERTVQWDDVAPGLAVLPTLSGIDFLREMIEGRLPPPPIAKLMGFTLTEVGPGTATFVCDTDESQYNPIGTVHGGLVCTLLDSAIGCAAQTTLSAGQGYTSIEIKINYLRPVLHDSGPLTAVGTVTKPGSRVAFAEGVVTDAAGKVVATASSSVLVFPIG